MTTLRIRLHELVDDIAVSVEEDDVVEIIRSDVPEEEEPGEQPEEQEEGDDSPNPRLKE